MPCNPLKCQAALYQLGWQQQQLEEQHQQQITKTHQLQQQQQQSADRAVMKQVDGLRHPLLGQGGPYSTTLEHVFGGCCCCCCCLLLLLLPLGVRRNPPGAQSHTPLHDVGRPLCIEQVLRKRIEG
ncbi:unnamed protein product [Polarella glacialis]|uniref:Uncharacterized protein n=1 Tax=Polarella glacialis TaxID=89957 RepID=A0A813DG04_POLGL|nr:unnamed protein product [Polarella glacialis]